MTSLVDRYRGCLLGLACGDAVGTSVEFSPRGSFPLITDMQGGGPFQLQAGQWTDDTSMALCLAESLLTKGGFDAKDQMTRYSNWWHWGYLSSTGTCFDIGLTVQKALRHYQVSGEPYAGSDDPNSAGNGSLMRLAPIALFYYPDFEEIRSFSAASSRTTHGAQEALEACQLFGHMLGFALDGASKSEIINCASALPFTQYKIKQLAETNYLTKNRAEIQGTGYVVESLEAALWCFYHTNSYKAAILEAVNLGDDADTTAAIVGQLAGAHYGVEQIPVSWLTRLHMGAEISNIADSLCKKVHPHSTPAES